MKLKQYLRHKARFVYLRKGNVFRFLFPGEARGYHLDGETKEVAVHFPDRRTLVLPNLPYPFEYFEECYQKGGYHLEHPSTKRPVKKTIHNIELRNGEDEFLRIRTTNAGDYDYLMKQYDALSFIPDRTIRFEEKELRMTSGSRGISHWEETVLFENILAYEAFATEVRKTISEPTAALELR